MEIIKYRTLTFGPSSELILLAIDDELKLVAVAAKDGSINIYSQVSEIIQSLVVVKVTDLQFLKGKGCLVALSNDGKIEIVPVQPQGSQFTNSKFFLGSSISSFHLCQDLYTATEGTLGLPILIVDTDISIELLFINKADITRTQRVVLRQPSPQNSKIIRVYESAFCDGKIIITVLWEDGIEQVAFMCPLIYRNGSFQTTFDIDHIVLPYTRIDGINNISIYGLSKLLFSTDNGTYGKIRGTEYMPNKGQIVHEMFPYGPFPCKGISKSFETSISGIKEKCYIFSGGLPAVTYKDVNSISVAILDEPEICFTFYDTVVDWAVISQNLTNESSLRTLKEIIVMTKSQVISITKDGDMWNSSNNCFFSPVFRSAVMAISNTVDNDFNLSSRFFASFHNDNSLVVWHLSDDKCSQHTELDIGSFFWATKKEKCKKIALWPKFQKCGLWKKEVNHPQLEIRSLKLLPRDNDTFSLIFCINGLWIFHFKLLFNLDGGETRSVINVERHLHQVLVDGNPCCDQNLDDIKLNKEDLDIPRAAELESIISLSETLELSDMEVNGDIITICGSKGICVVDSASWKHLSISSEDLSLVESSQNKGILSDIIQKRLMKRKSFESSNIKSGSLLKSPKSTLKTKSLTIVSFCCFPEGDMKMDLIIGFNNGLLMILSLIPNEVGDFTVSSTYKRMQTAKKEPLITVFVLDNFCDVPANPTQKLNKKSASEEYRKISTSIESTQESSVSTESKSTHKSNECDQMRNDSFTSNKKLKAATLKWLSSSKKVSKNEPMILQCDKHCVKIIDYVKLKTRFKYKIRSQSQQSEKTLENSALNTIIEAKVLKRNNCLEDNLVILLTGGVILRLSLPSLTLIDSYDMCEHILNNSLFSISKDLIVIPRNVSVYDEVFSIFLILDEREKAAIKNKRTSSLTEAPRYNDVISLKSKPETDLGEIDFMRGAESSFNSLLW